MKRKRIITVGAVLTLSAVIFICLLIGNPLIAYHNRELKAAVISTDGDEVTLNEVVPFEWEAVYTFDPYTSKAEIEEAIGFRSSAIRETVSEGMVQLLFVNGNSVSASVCGYADSLGYRVDFSGCVTYGEKAAFLVTKDSGITVLTEK